MTFAELQTEFLSRGFDYLGEDAAGRVRAKRWLNISYLQLCEAFPWPFLETEQSGVPPLALTDMRAVLWVLNPTTLTKLDYIETRELTDRTANVATTGTSLFYWLDSNTLKTYPVGTNSVTVRYLKVPAELVADGDTPVVPNRFSDLIVDGAVIRGLRDSDNFTDVTALQTTYAQDLGAMAASLMVRNASNPDTIASRAFHLDA